MSKNEVRSLGDHLGRELRLLLGEGGAEGGALSDPVRLDRPGEREDNQLVKSENTTIQNPMCILDTRLYNSF